MASSYTGLFVLKTPSGQITDVQVVDTAGNSLPLPIQDYIDRDIQPPYETLPDEGEYYKK